MMEPVASLLLPVLNEEAHLDDCLSSLAAQDSPEQFEVLVIDGGSTDATVAVAQRFADRLDLRVIENPARVQSLGCNAAARDHARGDVLIRLDGHVTYAEDYVSSALAALRGSDAVAVGGRQIPVAATPWARAAAEAMTSRAAAGPAAYRHIDAPTLVDTVYLGTFGRADFLAVGGYRALPSGVGEDTDLYARWRRAGRTILLDPAIRSRYHPRATPDAFARQHWRYGVGKAELLWLDGRFPSWRPLAPLALVVGLVATGTLGVLTGLWGAFGGLLTAWLLVASYVGIWRGCSIVDAARIALAVILMHLPFGVGLLWGLARGPARVRRSVAAGSAATGPSGPASDGAAD